ncbi:hypothetical protein Dda_4128 [Drechslerella dactyloides]|uniref:Uncharacterized protein n=1 Tax=Drechslerella dactyloides TaxID=74499 RepID=A0AAD6NLS2_DREDA|nr:hypothetical protein Dda_4128 [Drechslerella dactyloides]
MNYLFTLTSKLIPLLILCSLVADVTASGYYQKSVKTVRSCSTQYCDRKVYHVPTQIRTVHGNTKSTVTVHPKPSTCYVTKKWWTKTIDRYFTKTYTVTKCRTQTAYTTQYSTVTSTVRAVSTTTSSITIATITSGTTTIPQPSGFISVADDPDNQFNRIDKRGAKHYPTAVKCTKTIQTIYKHTVTARPRKTTVVKCGKTTTRWHAHKTAQKTVNARDKTTTITHISTRTTTTTLYTSTTTVTTSVTAIIPSATAYQACGNGNTFAGPNGSVSGWLNNWDTVFTGLNEAQCCALCQAHVNAAGVPDCQGSYWSWIRESGLERCWLVLTAATSRMCSFNTAQSFEAQPDTSEFIGVVSNGPCGRWKSVG